MYYHHLAALGCLLAIFLLLGLTGCTGVGANEPFAGGRVVAAPPSPDAGITRLYQGVLQY